MDLEVIVRSNRSTHISTLKQKSFHIYKRGQKEILGINAAKKSVETAKEALAK